jgi:hypothetical protein
VIDFDELDDPSCSFTHREPNSEVLEKARKRGERHGTIHKDPETGKKKWWFVIRCPETGELLDVLEEGKDCTPWNSAGDYHGHCGGCTNCLVMQAEHAKLSVGRTKYFPEE